MKTERRKEGKIKQWEEKILLYTQKEETKKRHFLFRFSLFNIFPILFLST